MNARTNVSLINNYELGIWTETMKKSRKRPIRGCIEISGCCM